MQQHIRIKKRKPGTNTKQVVNYSFEGYEPYIEICQALHEAWENWFLKGTQVGFSTVMIAYNLYLPKWKGLDSGYCLPNKVNIKPFMKTRFTEEQIAKNPELQDAYEMHESDLYYTTGENYLYFIGANVLEEGMTKPMEQVALDEVTVINTEQIEMMEDRLGAAAFGQLNGFAMEIYPQGPTEKGFDSGTQSVMLFKCPHCNKDDQNLEELAHQSSMNRETLPPFLKEVDGVWKVVCIHCQKPYRRSQCGRWVSRHPGRDIHSWRVPQWIFEGLSLERMARRWLKSKGKKAKRAHLHSTMCAIPDAGDLQGIQKEHIIKVKSDYEMRRSSEWSVGGCDVGNTCHVTFGDLAGESLRYLCWQTVDGDNMVEILSRLIQQMNCRKFVIDYKPFTPQVRALQEKFPGIVVAHEYREGGLVENEKEHSGRQYDFVQEEREEALDMYDDLISAEPPAVMLPARCIEEGGLVDLEDSLFAKHHYKGSQKEELEDKRLAKKIFKHLRAVENHYYHAGNYMYTALRLLGKDAAKFVGILPRFGSLN